VPPKATTQVSPKAKVGCVPPARDAPAFVPILLRWTHVFQFLFAFFFFFCRCACGCVCVCAVVVCMYVHCTYVLCMTSCIVVERNRGESGSLF
jgi:hypothetical protein